MDALDAIETIDSGLASRFDGKDRPQWERTYRQKRTECAALLAKVAADGLLQSDARAVAVNAEGSLVSALRNYDAQERAGLTQASWISRRSSGRLELAVLKANNPEKFRDRLEQTNLLDLDPASAGVAGQDCQPDD